MPVKILGLNPSIYTPAIHCPSTFIDRFDEIDALEEEILVERNLRLAHRARRYALQALAEGAEEARHRTRELYLRSQLRGKIIEMRDSAPRATSRAAGRVATGVAHNVK